MHADDARKKMLAGIKSLADAVKVTMGPTGKVVVIEKSYGAPTVTKDGVTVAKEVELKDPLREHGRPAGEGSCSKTSTVAGDGTTTATVLAEAVFREGLKITSTGANPTDVKRGIDKAVEAAVEAIAKLSTKIKSNDEIAQVGTVSANNDAEIGAAGRGHGQGRQGRRHHRRRSQEHRDHPRPGRRHAVRQGLPVALLRRR